MYKRQGKGNGLEINGIVKTHVLGVNLQNINKMCIRDRISYYTNLTEDETALTKRLEGTGIIFKSEPPDAFGEFMAMMLSVLLPSVLLFVLLMFFMRRMNKGGGGVMGVGKSRAKAYVQKETGITFKDVAGQDEAKESDVYKRQC